MLRVTTLHAACAAATASYYARYLVAAPGEVPGVWSGRQAAGIGLSGRVEIEQLESLLSGRDPSTGAPLGRELLDRYTADGRVVRAVSGFDATFSAPKSLSVWWALTGDHRLLEVHDVAVTAALAHLERFGSTTRIRSSGGRLHPDTNGLTMARFRQTTSRADDPQIHTHAVISAKVRTADGRWLALDARYLKRHQRMLGGLYQSVLRTELTHRFGVDWRPIENGQSEIAGVPGELLAVFSKRSVDIDVALAGKLDEFGQRQGREPSRWERAALTREASADTRSRKSGHGAADLATRWHTEAADAGWTADRLEASIDRSAADARPTETITVTDVIDAVSDQRSSWSRADVLQAICDRQRPVSSLAGGRWADTLERAADRVLDHLVDLDPPGDTSRRASDGRSVWIEPTAARFTSESVLAQEEWIMAWAIAAQAAAPAPSTTVNRGGLDPLQGDAAAAVAGNGGLALVVGPAGAGKTRMLAAVAADLDGQGRVVFAVAPTAKAARTVERDTGIRADTVAKLLHEWHRSDRPPEPEYCLPAGATVIVDEAGMISTPALHRLVALAEAHRWRLVLVGDPHQLQGVGRGGLFAELCANGRVNELERLHRFTHRWEACASLQLRAGDPLALDAYEARGRIVAGPLDEHLDRLAASWINHHRNGQPVALVASTNDHVDLVNHAVQAARRHAGHLGLDAVVIAGGERAHVGDVVATRRNDRRLITSQRQPVRNRDTWTVTDIEPDGTLTVSHRDGHGDVTLPADYVRDHVRLGYAATEHGWQSDTVTTAIALASPATTRRGLYVAATRGSEQNVICVVTDSNAITEARDVLEAILAVDRADIPAVTQRRTLAHQLAGAPQTTVAKPLPPRCAVPQWFDSVLHRAERNLAEAEARNAESVARRAHLARAATAAEHTFGEISAATFLDRDAYAQAATRADEARWNHAAANRRLENAPRRRRRSLRREVDIAQQEMGRAKSDLELTRRRTAPSIDRYEQATATHRDVVDQLRSCNLADQLDTLAPSVDQYRQQVMALARWREWADGAQVPIEDLRDAIDTLTSDDRPYDSRTGQLVDSLQSWAREHEVGICDPTALARPRSAPRLGRDL